MLCINCQTVNDEKALHCLNCGTPFPPNSSGGLDTTWQLPASFFAQAETISPEKAAEVDPLIGQTLGGRYLLESRLGTGGMGTVYRATRVHIGDDVAVKILHSHQLSTPDAGERFRREAQLTARLKHPNAVLIYDYGTTESGIHYLVMELAEGDTLRQIVKSRGPLMPSAAVEITSQVCAALHEAHGQGIVHRDLKPDNILAQSTAGGLRVKVLDFGIAKFRDQTASNLTLTGSVMGTPHYMSPEQCLGEELDGRSDIYSMGVILFEALCGVLPFSSPISTAVVVQHVSQPPPRLRTFNMSISEAMEAAVLHALEKRREDRPQTVEQFVQELRDALKGTMPTQSAFPALESLASGAHPSRGTMPTMVVTRSLAVPHYSTPQAVPSIGLRHGEPARAGGLRKNVIIISAIIILLGVGAIVAFFMTSKEPDASAKARTTPRRENANAPTDIRPTPTATVSSNVSVAAPSPSPSATPVLNVSAARENIMTILSGWSASLRRRDIESNLRFYANYLDVFYGVSGARLGTVRENRQRIFNRFHSIDVQLSDIKITFDSSGTKAFVAYDNSYTWNGRGSVAGKSHNEMVLDKSNDQWLITSEKHINTYFENRY